MYQKFVIPAVEPESRPLNRSCYPYDKLDSRFIVRAAGCPGMTRQGFTSNRHPETLRAAFSGPGQKGFTLIELLLVVLIIGILASVALPQYQKAVEKSRAAEALSLVKTIGLANQTYFLANGSYTTDLRNLDIDIPGTDAVHSVPRRVSKYFSYRASLSPSYDEVEGIALANRIPINMRYAIGFMPDGTLKCFYKTEKDKAVCDSFHLPSVKYW